MRKKIETNYIKIKLALYAIVHFGWECIRNPRSIPRYIKVANLSLQKGGVQKLIDDIFRVYLPKKYLLKTKLHIKEPSTSIFSKIRVHQAGINTCSVQKNVYKVDANVSILIIRAGAMGDVLLATPIVKLLHEKYDGLCLITVATRYPAVFTNNPYIYKTLSIKELRYLENNYDVILNLDLCYEKNRFLHITSAYNFLAFGAHQNNQFLQPELFLSNYDEKIVEKWLNDIGGPYIVCHNRIDPSQQYRNVKPKDWEYLITELSVKTGLKILQIGGEELDVALTNKDLPLIDARGKLSLQQSKGLIENAALFIGTDAGPLHIAACTKTPIVSFFTIAHHEVRKPLRSPDAIFTAITPEVSCYGCQNLYPFGSQWECERGDFACTSKFNIKNALNACLSIIK
ncbi:ADP-heptose:LPS heptosyltransferase [Polynucleobacter duraquae]|uniref:ADP-heptose:LPS heptosyltransferase n=1 Tax=Polynucleobacter duraquae TaxID=1835254 RepID=A0A0E3ZIP0_9BURK|nr:glycosyltransferase family 9 protein [Polynucleobacter duraquae]AKD24605.1 ADP-heptose:LPS heptosyltransferase [Polynucleobacter duraquae]